MKLHLKDLTELAVTVSDVESWSSFEESFDDEASDDMLVNNSSSWEHLFELVSSAPKLVSLAIGPQGDAMQLDDTFLKSLLSLLISQLTTLDFVCGIMTFQQIELIAKSCPKLKALTVCLDWRMEGINEHCKSLGEALAPIKTLERFRLRGRFREDLHLDPRSADRSSHQASARPEGRSDLISIIKHCHILVLLEVDRWKCWVRLQCAGLKSSGYPDRSGDEITWTYRSSCHVNI